MSKIVGNSPGARTHILALDQGTTSSRAIVFDLSGTPKCVAQREFEQIYPKPGWVEHDPMAIWTSQIEVAGEALSRSGLGPKDLAVIGITNQRETTVVWERSTGRPIHNAIVWQDRRTADTCNRLKAEGQAEVFRSKTGLVIDAYFSGTKVQWLLDNVDGARSRAEAGELAFGTIDTWLVWQLTEGRTHVTDASNASRTLLYNIHTGDWDDELLHILDVPRAILPDVRATSELLAEASVAPVDGVAIGSVVGDQQSALFGQMCVNPGMVKNTYGTGCFTLLNTGTEAMASANGLLTTVAWRIGGRTEYALEGSVFIAGAVVQWLRDGLGVIGSSSEVEELAGSVPDNGGVLLVPAFAGLGAPHWDPYARGTILGITRGTTAGHIARAALESIAYQSADVMEAMASDSMLAASEIRADGGAAANDLLMQFQADILGLPVVRPKVLETTALGAAYLAGIAAGCWESRGEIAQQWQQEARFEPRMDVEKAEELKGRWREAVRRAKGWSQDIEN